MSESKTLRELGLSSRRTVLKGGLAAAAAVALPAGVARANPSRTPAAPLPLGPTATRIKNLTGPNETGQWGAALTDLGIPALCPNGTMLFVCGDTFEGPNVGDGQWTAPAGLRSSSADLGNLTIDGAVGGAHVQSMVPEPHTPVPPDKATTAIPSDAFTVGDTMYMHLMRGVIYDTHHTELWSSKDNGDTWTLACSWDDPGLHRGNFQQKTYAIGDNGTAYVFSGLFNRGPVSELLLHRVALDRLGDPAGYEPWGWDGSKWGWGIPPTTVATPRKWGEICFRAMGGKFAFSFFDESAAQIKLQVFPIPESDLFTTPEQVLIQGSDHDAGNDLRAPYGGWIVPGSTFDNFHAVISQWIYPTPDYRVIHYKFDGIAS
ncbi:DUF4185 domain-containing protein [Luteipulveratus mongoliensis]|uniref:DUF4185 domain-containing protein n=1 Tax=Luteipulveratus mongoliensis TaxID=571913 RepID=A0A0K1JG45_9MICO|nr:DUF4185 domain-containing protein [Luteipulveratus mongoliensis]AKU15558.1 hypothetical protein VV02_06285 [Luteipulveratus mongoliensis]